MKKTNLIESILPGSGKYSLKTELRLDLWAMVAIVTYVGGKYLVSNNPDWHAVLRVLISILPLVPMVLYGFKFKRFICALDELQRRIQTGVMLFAALGTLLIGIVVSTLNEQGVSTWKFGNGLGYTGVFLSMLILWFIGSYIAHRFNFESDEE